jgi:hypothetical protein
LDIWHTLKGRSDWAYARFTTISLRRRVSSGRARRSIWMLSGKPVSSIVMGEREKRGAKSEKRGMAKRKKEEKYLVHCSLTGTNEHYLVEMTTRLVILGGSASSPPCPRRAFFIILFRCNTTESMHVYLHHWSLSFVMFSGTFGLRISRYTSVLFFCDSGFYHELAQFVMLLGWGGMAWE